MMALWRARGEVSIKSHILVYGIVEGKGGKCRPRPPAEQLQLHNLFLGGRGQETTTTSR